MKISLTKDELIEYLHLKEKIKHSIIPGEAHLYANRLLDLFEDAAIVICNSENKENTSL